MKRLSLIILCIFSVVSLLHAQETIVVGEVYDANTGANIPNVHIYLQGTQIGTSTNAEGMFLLRANLEQNKTMVVSAVGYQTERFKIEAHSQSGIEIALKEKVGNLGEVFVTPNENPALPLMEKVRARRQQNATKYTGDIISSTALYVSDIQAKHLQRSLWKNLQAGMIQQDSTYFLPLYWRQEQADSVREKATLLTETDYQVLLSQLPKSFNFYDNNLAIFSATMLSPLAAAGNTYYHYYLIDSTQVGTEKHYLLHFKTKNPFYATFNGEMTIDSASCALRHIKVSVPQQNSVNYLRRLSIEQHYASNNTVEKESIDMLMDFAIKADSSRYFPTLLLTRNTQMTQVNEPTASIKTPLLNATDSLVLPALDSLNNTMLFKTAKLVAYVIQTGCIPTSKYVEIGKVHHVFKLNQGEGFRFGLPLRTTEELWKNVCLEAMVAYGFGDRAWKGFGQINIAFPTQRRHQMYLKYSDEYVYSDVDEFHEVLRENIVFNRQINMVTRMMQGVPFNQQYYYNTTSRRQEGRIHFENDWNKYLETQSYFKIGQQGYGLATKDYNGQPTFFYSTLGTTARISFNERKVDWYFQRRHIYNDLPIIYVGAELGSYRLGDMPSYRMYGNLQFLLRHNVNLGMAGELDYRLQAGLVFGKVPYPLLHHFAGNQTHTFDPDRFSLMNTFQYAADQFIALHAHWNGKGVLFNLIPGVRYARLRELLVLKVAYGGQRNNHQEVLAYPTINQENYQMLSSLNVPYVEVGAGIGNILRIGEVYGVFRVTHLNDPTPWWAIRFRLHLGM
ncbi:MAG: carboxypeptidase-like regulatory domain-containing protein [Paludibacteraceae bacterium]|nr:carboxypeptidase-like regulatory domain-containing protein [Paludibacteraceae bacterium]